jgi:hypothetical protein
MSLDIKIAMLGEPGSQLAWAAGGISHIIASYYAQQ